MAVPRSESSKDRADQDRLEQYIKKGYKIFMDTCSLMYINAEKFWEHIVPLLHQYSVKIIIPLKCIEELKKHQSDNGDVQKAASAQNALKVVNQLIKAGYIDVRGETSDNFADNVFNVVFTKFRMQYNLLLITQDNDLADDILKLNDSKSVKSPYKIEVKRINKYGYFSGVGSAVKAREEANKKKPNRNPVQPDVVVPDEEKFEVCHTITQIKDDIIRVKHIPRENEEIYVFHNGEFVPVRLTKELGAGGEATIYTTNTPFVAKIYKESTNTRRKHEKIKRMLSKPIECEGICYPVAEAFNANKEFVGYLMPAAKGKELQRSIFLVKQLFLKNFPGWKKRDTVELCITILEKIKYLHDRNIIMGDINPANILVVSPREVYFVDTDSYQIEDFPCPVGTINYTAPEIQRKHFGDFLRSFGNEYFAVATLLFMIMLPGKPPYSQQGGEDPIANIINMDFSYPFGDNSNKKTPDGPWRYIWSHLTYDLKEAFYTTFHKGEIHSTENQRLTVDEWLSLFRYYLELLDSGKYGQQDKMSEELYPTRHKKSDKFTYVHCQLCGNEVPENHCQNGYCRDCLNKGEVYKCSRCGKDILFTNYLKLIKHAKKYDICFDCYQWGQQVKQRIRCEDCGRTFDLTNSQWEFYRKKGFDLPKRCKSCRDAKKAGVSRYSSQQSSYSRPSTPYGSSASRPSSNTTTKSNSSTKKNGSFCFITTAVCEYYGKADDCRELTILRNYRDSWLRKQPDGELLIQEYYRTAPLLVALMKQSEFYPEYCENLLSHYIEPCLKLIAEGKNAECKELYSKMFYFMKSEFMEG